MDKITEVRLPTALDFKPVDGWVNLDFASPASVGLDVDYLFPGLAERLEQGTGVEQLLAAMDAAGVERAVLTSGFQGRGVEGLEALTRAVDAAPNRFAASLVVDPLQAMETVRLIRRAVLEADVRLVRLLAYEVQRPYDDAVYFPVYTVCAELGVPVGINVGLPGPRVAGQVQHPLAVDSVCAYFPELQVVLSHGGAPWVDECVHLLRKWPELYYMTSAYAPRRVPAPVIDFLNRSGSDKIIWATDYPVIGFEQSLEQLAGLDVRSEDVLRKYARDNAMRLFFERG